MPRYCTNATDICHWDELESGQHHGESIYVPWTHVTKQSSSYLTLLRRRHRPSREMSFEGPSQYAYEPVFPLSYIGTRYSNSLTRFWKELDASRSLLGILFFSHISIGAR